jgi:hypothetical protein
MGTIRLSCSARVPLSLPYLPRCSLAAPRKIYKIPSEKALFVFHNCMQEAPLRLLLACRLSLWCCCCVRGESRNRSPHTVFCSGVHLSLKFLILFAYKKSKLCLMRRPFHKNTHILFVGSGVWTTKTIYVLEILKCRRIRNKCWALFFSAERILISRC